MEEKIISASNEKELWDQVANDLQRNPDPLNYQTILELNDHRVVFEIHNNHATGFEAESYTSFSTYLFGRDNFKFNLHTQTFTDSLGKVFGMQDVILGFGDFDDKFIIKTNDEKRVIDLFADPVVRLLLISLPNLSFGIIEYTMEDADGKAPFLELKIGKAIADPSQLSEILAYYLKTLAKLV